ncbi:hypothetical protein GJ700_02575 [Duganella sp. FT92W]|uniref:Uncharacterized protein n=1 Tax=Pseudoduganella rivuli TaxID=2666085 RepID=A0A7X2LSA7_9BURK|nr:hypothetical protein [Pseudoduganella rivuli]MRV70604.1 hypothetical protein [Pseudoduganella rivuli]
MNSKLQHQGAETVDPELPAIHEELISEGILAGPPAKARKANGRQSGTGRSTYPVRTTLEREEAKIWVRIYGQANDPVLAAELLQLLNSDAHIKAKHLGLYLRCRQSLRLHKERQARVKRMAYILRLAMRCLFVLPAHIVFRIGVGLRRALHFGRDVALEACPQEGSAATLPRNLYQRQSQTSAQAKASTDSHAKSA